MEEMKTPRGCRKARSPVSQVLFLISVLSLLPAAAPRSSADDWLQFNGDAGHSGSNSAERAITTANVGRLTVLFKVKLPDVADGAPAYASGVEMLGGPRDMLFLTTRAGHIVAVNAASGALVWVKQYAANGCRVNNGFLPCYTTASPAVDPQKRFVYSYGLDGYVHKYSIANGSEITGENWPALTTLKPFNEKGSSNLCIATDRAGVSYLYMAHAGYPGDRGDYQGHLTIIRLSDGEQRVFNADCSDIQTHFKQRPATPDCPAVQTAVWARAGVVYDSALDRIFFATGNGSFDPSRHNWGDSVLSLHPDGSGAPGGPLDSYTPPEYQLLDDTDADLGSTAPAIIPVSALTGIRHLAVQGGKDGKLRLIDLANLSARGGPGNLGGELEIIPVPQGGEVLTAPAVWVNPTDGGVWIFVSNGNGISGIRLMAGKPGRPRLEPRWKSREGGTSPIVAGGVLFYAGSFHLSALKPTDGSTLWESKDIGRIHWESPIVADARLSLTDETGALTVYALPQRN
jgi:outer membrane protein assembly factor BamB